MPGVPILLCAWHVKRAWLKNLTSTVADAAKRQEIWAALDVLMRLNVQLPAEHSSAELSKLCEEALRRFFERFSEHAAFIAYFKKEWASKVGEEKILPPPENLLFLTLGTLSVYMRLMNKSTCYCRALGTALSQHAPL